MSDYRQEAVEQSALELLGYVPSSICESVVGKVIDASGLLDRIAEKDTAIHNLHNDVGTLTSELNRVRQEIDAEYRGMFAAQEERNFNEVADVLLREKKALNRVAELEARYNEQLRQVQRASKDAAAALAREKALRLALQRLDDGGNDPEYVKRVVAKALAQSADKTQGKGEE